ncbi:hypothetical protein ACSBR1_020283 [Camellia fascicularis]
MKIGYGNPEERMNRYSPWKRKRPEHHGSYLTTPHTIGQKIDQFVNANMDLDIDTKRTSLKASASVVSLISVTGGTMMSACSGTIIGCEDVNGTYISTILTSTTLLRSPTDSNAVLDDLEVNVCVMDGKLFKGCVIAYDFHFNIATISIETDVALPTAIIRPLDDSISIDPSEIACTRDKEMTSKSLDCCEFDCKELFRANCIISMVMKGSPAEQAGILHGDVVVQCGKKVVESFLEGRVRFR